MERYRPDQSASLTTFDQSRLKRCVCLVDGKRHIRKFLRNAFEEFDFTTCGCANNSELDATLELQLADLIVLGPSADGEENFAMMRTLAAKEFQGQVLLLGANSPMLETMQVFGITLGLAMLEAMATPFRHECLRERLATLRPKKLQQCLIDLAQARRARTLVLHGGHRQDGSLTVYTTCSR